MLGKFAFLGGIGVFVNERHQDVGSDAVLVLFIGCLVLFNGWGGIAFEWYSNGGCERCQISKQGSKFCPVSLAPRW
jgi:hypothetical protein